MKQWIDRAGRVLTVAALTLGVGTAGVVATQSLSGKASVAYAAKNPCNPCAPGKRKGKDKGKKKGWTKNPCNPCNPCAARAKARNPCNPCNPCAAKAKPKNPCNPCNPCAGKK